MGKEGSPGSHTGYGSRSVGESAAIYRTKGMSRMGLAEHRGDHHYASGAMNRCTSLDRFAVGAYDLGSNTSSGEKILSRSGDFSSPGPVPRHSLPPVASSPRQPNLYRVLSQKHHGLRSFHDRPGSAPLRK